ncbi:MAG: tautomerase family protein [Candidatus Binatia bacterium]
MPVVHVYMFEGRTVGQKRKIVAGITSSTPRPVAHSPCD